MLEVLVATVILAVASGAVAVTLRDAARATREAADQAGALRALSWWRAEADLSDSGEVSSERLWSRIDAEGRRWTVAAELPAEDSVAAPISAEAGSAVQAPPPRWWRVVVRVQERVDAAPREALSIARLAPVAPRRRQPRRAARMRRAPGGPRESGLPADTLLRRQLAGGRRGLTLLEVLAALSLLSVFLVGVGSWLGVATRTARDAALGAGAGGPVRRAAAAIERDLAAAALRPRSVVVDASGAALRIVQGGFDERERKTRWREVEWRLAPGVPGSTGRSARGGTLIRGERWLDGQEPALERIALRGVERFEIGDGGMPEQDRSRSAPRAGETQAPQRIHALIVLNPGESAGPESAEITWERAP